jgi:hypothetical protein
MEQQAKEELATSGDDTAVLAMGADVATDKKGDEELEAALPENA